MSTRKIKTEKARERRRLEREDESKSTIRCVVIGPEFWEGCPEPLPNQEHLVR